MKFMGNHENKYLPQLKDAVPVEAYGYTVSMYSVALEGWRRGLTLRFINENRRRSEVSYSLSDKNGKTHYFSVARGDAVPREAIKICINKDLTKEYLSKAGVPIPEGETFGPGASDDEIVSYAEQLGYPLVLKPSDGTGGSGVIANIKDKEEFADALEYVKYQLGYKRLIVERYIPGEDYRMYVIDDEVIAAFKKNPANVVGDGVHSIKKLIDLKNVERTKTPALHNRPIKVDRETLKLLSSKGYDLDSIPPKNEKVILKTKNNVSSGGDSIDVTDQLTDEIKNVAIQASRAIPGLVQTGVDMMVDLETNTAAVLELNSRPHITAHLYPYEGKARDIPKAVIDYYFPETSQQDYKINPGYYFDFKNVFDSFTSGICKEYQIPDAPRGDLAATRFRVTGSAGSLTYKKWVRNHAIKLKLHGYIKDLSNGETSVVVSGPADSITKFREIIKKERPKNVSVGNVTEKSRTLPVKVGFEILENLGKPRQKKDGIPAEAWEYRGEGYHPVWVPEEVTAKKNTKPKQGRQNSATASNAKESDAYKKKYEQLRNSTSWKITKPVRAIGKFFK